MIDNPFKEFEEANDDVIPSTIPHLPRSVSMKIKISEEALCNLNSILAHVHQGTLSNRIGYLLEAIGLCQIEIHDPISRTDPESNITTDACRQAGYEDAIEGHPQRFLRLFGKMSTPFECAYIRGYIEGNYIRITR
jgi:hypothetical protein